MVETAPQQGNRTGKVPMGWSWLLQGRARAPDLLWVRHCVFISLEHSLTSQAA
jgi:hypothetical protein